MEQTKNISEHIEEMRKWKTESGGGISKLQVIRTLIFTSVPALVVLFVIYMILGSGKSGEDDYCNCD
jgi:Na+/H+ antiporter NhaC